MNTSVGEGGCSNSCAFILVLASQEVRSYPVSWLCRKKVNALYFEKFQKSSFRSLMLKSMAGSQHIHSYYVCPCCVANLRFLEKNCRLTQERAHPNKNACLNKSRYYIFYLNFYLNHILSH
ncbi:hypothetical protein GOODEAATRI_014465 [Goodea atripinnis]|uniref:Uncharacterized protein n=1 Tax=Goodea atripinnis TaxID=208336 RepID=A0ABV0PE42_9TELE